MTPEVRTKRLTKRFLVRWAFNLTQHIKLPDHKDRGKNRMWDDVGELDVKKCMACNAMTLWKFTC